MYTTYNLQASSEKNWLDYCSYFQVVGYDCYHGR